MFERDSTEDSSTPHYESGGFWHCLVLPLAPDEDEPHCEPVDKDDDQEDADVETVRDAGNVEVLWEGATRVSTGVRATEGSGQRERDAPGGHRCR